MKRKSKNLVLLAAIGLLIVSGEIVFFWITILALIFLSLDKKQNLMSYTRSPKLEMQRMSRRYGLNIVKGSALESLLHQVYSEYGTSVKNYPHLQKDYGDILTEMWTHLSKLETSMQQQKLVSSVLAGWPKQQKVIKTAVQAQMERVQELSRQWDEAQRDAMGVGHV